MIRVAQGGSTTFTAQYQNSLGVLTAPTAPVVTIYDPDGTVMASATPTLVTLAAYTYTYTVAADAERGVWWVQWTGLIDGSPTSGTEFFEVALPGAVAVGTSYVTVDELRSYVGIPADDDADDTLLLLAAESASAQIDAYCRQSWPSPESAPSPIRQATLLQASRLFVRKNSPYGIAGSPDMGSELRLLAKLDPDVEVLVRPYRLQWWVLT